MAQFKGHDGIASITESWTSDMVFVQGGPGKLNSWLAKLEIYLYFLLQVPEPKDLVIDPQLMKPLDHFTGASFLKVTTACHVVLSLVFNLFGVIVLCVAGLSECKAIGMWSLKSHAYTLWISFSNLAILNESTIMVIQIKLFPPFL